MLSFDSHEVKEPCNIETVSFSCLRLFAPPLKRESLRRKLASSKSAVSSSRLPRILSPRIKKSGLFRDIAPSPEYDWVLLSIVIWDALICWPLPVIFTSPESAVISPSS